MALILFVQILALASTTVAMDTETDFGIQGFDLATLMLNRALHLDKIFNSQKKELDNKRIS